MKKFNAVNSNGEILVFTKVKEFKQFLKKLKHLPENYNRITIGNHTDTIEQSIKQINVLRGIVVVKTDIFGEGEQYYIIDGQHLVEALMKTDDKDIKGMLIVYIENTTKFEKIAQIMTILNNTAKSWTLKNYMELWATYGLDDYRKLASIHTRDKTAISVLIELYTGQVYSGSNSFKLGKFQPNWIKGEELVEVFKESVKLGLPDTKASFAAFVRFSARSPKYKKDGYLNFVLKMSNAKKWERGFNRSMYINYFDQIK